MSKCEKAKRKKTVFLDVMRERERIKEKSHKVKDPKNSLIWQRCYMQSLHSPGSLPTKQIEITLLYVCINYKTRTVNHFKKVNTFKSD